MHPRASRYPSTARLCPRAAPDLGLAGSFFESLLQPRASYVLEEGSESPSTAFQKAAAAAQAAHQEIICTGAIAETMQQSKQVADIMQLYSELQATYHTAVMPLIERHGALAATTAGLAYAWCCEALGRELELGPGDSISQEELQRLVKDIRAMVSRPPIGVAAVALTRILQAAGSKPVRELVLPDVVSFISTGGSDLSPLHQLAKLLQLSEEGMESDPSFSELYSNTSQESLIMVLLSAVANSPPMHLTNTEDQSLTRTLLER